MTITLILVSILGLILIPLLNPTKLIKVKATVSAMPGGGEGEGAAPRQQAGNDGGAGPGDAAEEEEHNHEHAQHLRRTR